MKEDKDWKERITKVEIYERQVFYIDFKPVYTVEEWIDFIESEKQKSYEDGRRGLAHDLLDDYYEPDRDSIEIDISVLQNEIDKGGVQGYYKRITEENIKQEVESLERNIERRKSKLLKDKK